MAQPMPRLSLFAELERAVGARVPVLTLTKATLVHLSHTLEDIVLRNELPALLFTGFQESSHWRKEVERYQRLAGVAKQICIFAGKPLPEYSAASALQIQLDPDDPFRQEWFLAILSAEFSVVLCGLDNLADVPEESLRRFRTIWSFEPQVVDIALNVVERQVARYRPDKLAELQQYRGDFPLRQPDARLLSQFTAEMILFEERLNQIILDQNKALLQRETLQSMVVKSAPLLLVAVDLDSNVIFYDWENVPRLAVVQPPFAGQPVSLLAGDIPGVESIVAQALAGETVFQGIVTDEGNSIDIHAAPVIDNQTVKGAVLVLIDVTEIRQAESFQREYERLQNTLTQERAVSALKDRIMRIISHEFRNPLATMLNASQLLRQFADRLSEEERQQGLLGIQQQIMRLSEMVQDVSMVIRNSGEGVPLRLQPVVLKKLIDEEIENLRMVHNVKNPIQNDYTLPSSISPQLDERVFRRVLHNLLSNAAKYSSADAPITIQTRQLNRSLVIAVADHGIGIPQENLAVIFEPFQRGDNVGQINGLGLGLAIVSDGVSLHGGKVEVNSVPGQGTVFTLRIPFVPG